MEQQAIDSWPNAIRIIHLNGGCRAVNNPGPYVVFDPKTIEEPQFTFKINKYGEIFHRLEAIGLITIGVDFFTHMLESEGLQPPNWRSYHRSESSSWPTEESAQTWKNIGHAAFKQKNGRLWDIGSRIGHQLRVCDWRVREISEAYRKQLTVNLKTKSFEVGKMYEDGFSWLSYLSIQSYLVDACILRDYLAEFMSEFLYGSQEDMKITAMGPFKKKVLNKIAQEDNFTLQLKQATHKDGWITQLGNYRDLVVHSSPLAQAKSRLFSTCGELTLRNGSRLPSINCPLPEDPANILKSRSSGSHFEDFDKQFNLFIEAAKGGIPMVDGLDYAGRSLGQLARLAYIIAKKSPINPEVPLFNKSNIIGGIKIKSYKG